MTITPAAFDALDQRVALTAYVEMINAASDWNFQIGRLRSQIEKHVGPINRPFSVVLRGWRYEIVPSAYAS
jgi:phage FluMu protein gp41